MKQSKITVTLWHQRHSLLFLIPPLVTPLSSSNTPRLPNGSLTWSVFVKFQAELNTRQNSVSYWNCSNKTGSIVWKAYMGKRYCRRSQCGFQSVYSGNSPQGVAKTHIIIDPIQTQMESPESPQLQTCSVFWAANNFLEQPVTWSDRRY